MNTEEQAKAKWCPLTNNENGFTCCIASECMAWRVEKGDAESNGAGNWLPVGYCGLAGKP
jgi:hypothetical protein